MGTAWRMGIMGGRDQGMGSGEKCIGLCLALAAFYDDLMMIF